MEKVNEFIPNEPVGEALDKVIKMFEHQKNTQLNGAVVILFGDDPNAKNNGHTYFVTSIKEGYYTKRNMCILAQFFAEFVTHLPEDNSGE